MSGRTPIIISLVILCLLCPAQVSTQTNPSNLPIGEARRLFDAAKIDRDNGRWSQALTKLERVLVIKESAGVHYYIGICKGHLGRLTESAASLRTARSMAQVSKAQDVLAVVDRQLADLEARLPILFVDIVNDTSATLYLDRRLLSREDPLQINPGEHSVEVHWTGGSVVTEQISVREYERRYLTLAPPVSPKPTMSVMLPFKTAHASSAIVAQPKPNNSSNLLPIGAYVIGGAFLIGAGTSYWWSTRISQNTTETCVGAIVCDPQRARDVSKFESIAWGGLVLGTVFTATGMYLTFQSPKRTQFRVSALGLSGTF